MKPKDIKKRKKLSEKVEAISKSIDANPLLAYCVSMGFIKVPGPALATKIAENMGMKQGDADDLRLDAHNVLNQIKQCFASAMGGDISSIRGYASGTVGMFAKNTAIGQIISDAIAVVTDKAYKAVMNGQTPHFIKTWSQKEKSMVYNFSITCALLRDESKFGFKLPLGVDGPTVRKMLDKQIAANIEKPAGNPALSKAAGEVARQQLVEA